MSATKRYATFAEFYPFYLSEHVNRTCRRLHFAGTSVRLGCLVAAAATWNAWWLRPATFTYPLYSFIGDWAMWRDILTGGIAF